MSVTGWPGRPRGPLVFASLPTLGQVHTAAPGFYVATGDLNSGQLACIASTLWSGPFPQLPMRNLRPLHFNGDKQALGIGEMARWWLGCWLPSPLEGLGLVLSSQLHTEPLYQSL